MVLFDKILGYENQETKRILDVLKSGNSPDTDFIVLTHILNVSKREKPCAYYGRFRDKNGTDYLPEQNNKVNRCLAVETETRKTISCPFFNESIEGKCDYPYNQRLNI